MTCSIQCRSNAALSPVRRELLVSPMLSMVRFSLHRHSIIRLQTVARQVCPMLTAMTFECKSTGWHRFKPVNQSINHNQSIDESINLPVQAPLDQHGSRRKNHSNTAPASGRPHNEGEGKELLQSPAGSDWLAANDTCFHCCEA